MKAMSDHLFANTSQQVSEEQHQAMLRACTLYSMNDMLYKDGVISMEKKQKVAEEIWRKYHV